MWSSKRTAGAALVRRLCNLGLPLEGIVPALMRALRREVPCDADVVLWFDAAGEIANLYAPGLPPPQALATWFKTGEGLADAPAAVVARAPGAVARRVVRICGGADSGAATPPEAETALGLPGEIDCRHRHLCERAAPAGASSQRLCGTIDANAAPVAALTLYRSSAGPAFTADERVALRAACRYLSLNADVVPASSGAAAYRASGENALLLCERDGRIAKASSNGYALLAQVSGCPINRRTVGEELEYAWRERLRNLLSDLATPQARDARDPSRCATLINNWGLFRLCAFFQPDGPIGVLIERVDHQLVRLTEAMMHLDLSVQQGEALLLLAQGYSHDRLAARIGVAPSTADYHIRQLYAKLGAHTRNEAIANALAAGEANGSR